MSLYNLYKWKGTIICSISTEKPTICTCTYNMYVRMYVQRGPQYMYSLYREDHSTYIHSLYREDHATCTVCTVRTTVHAQSVQRGPQYMYSLYREDHSTCTVCTERTTVHVQSVQRGLYNRWMSYVEQLNSLST